MEAGLMEIVRSLNRSWIYDTYFSYIELFIRGEKSGEEMSGGKCPDTPLEMQSIGQV